MTEAILITGGNVGDVEATLARAAESVGQRAGRVTRRSSVMTSEPWGEVSPDVEAPPCADRLQSDSTGKFLNQVLVVETELDPRQLLSVIQSIEKDLGRERTHAISAGERRYFSRTIDIDILFYGDQIIETPELTVPHPLIERREFVLRPLAGVLPGKVHPRTGLTAGQMLENLKNSNV